MNYFELRNISSSRIRFRGPSCSVNPENRSPQRNFVIQPAWVSCCAIIMAVGVSLVFAHTADAGFLGNSGLLPDCTDSKYRPEAFIVLIFNIIKFLWGLTGTIALVMFVVGGFTLLLAGGDPQRVKGGVTTIRNALIGILIVLGSWIIINTLVGILTTGTIPTGVVPLFTSEWSTTINPCY